MFNKDLKELLGIEKWLELNAKLQTKKSVARQILNEKGILQKKGLNDYDHYKYFTEAQYKEVSNELLVKAKLEIKVTELEYKEYTVANSKTPIGRQVKNLFTITDIETGFYEESIARGEGLDRGDKAGYKAYTGAVKYFLADTFLIPTGDDIEKESPKQLEEPQKKITTLLPKQRDIILNVYKEDNLTKLLQANGLKSIDEMSVQKASEIIKKLNEIKKGENNENN